MVSLQRLFKETKDSDVHEKYKKRMSRSCKHIKNSNILPEISYPKPGSKEFQADVDNIKHHYKNPCLPVSFLRDSDESVEDLFKSFCKENGIFVDFKNKFQTLVPNSKLEGYKVNDDNTSIYNENCEYSLGDSICIKFDTVVYDPNTLFSSCGSIVEV